MSVKNYYGNFNRNIKSKRPYGYTKTKNGQSKLLKKILISIIIVIVVIFLKKVDTKPTDRVIEIINNTINYNYDMKDVSKEVINFAKNLSSWPEKVKSVFFEDERANDKYVIPIEGRVYQKFGEEKKNNGVTLFHRGIDIIATDYSVYSIGNGEVIEIGVNKIYDKYIIINHEDVNAVYCMMDEILLKEGDTVTTGEKIGTLIKSGNGQNIFHFEIWKEGKPIDPLTIFDNQYSKSRI